MNAHHDPTRVDVRRLTKTFGTFRAVDDVSFSVCEGEIVGLVGPNGAGKTTIVHLLTGLITPTAGTFLLFGKSLNRDREWHTVEIKLHLAICGISGAYDSTRKSNGFRAHL